MITLHGRPLEPEMIESAEGYWRPLDLISAGTEARVLKVWCDYDWQWDFAESVVWFEMADRRQFALTTARTVGQMAYDAALKAGRQPDPVNGVPWYLLACAAVVVPVGHRVAIDPEYRHHILAELERMARAVA